MDAVVPVFPSNPAPEIQRLSVDPFGFADSRPSVRAEPRSAQVQEYQYVESSVTVEVLLRSERLRFTQICWGCLAILANSYNTPAEHATSSIMELDNGPHKPAVPTR